MTKDQRDAIETAFAARDAVTLSLRLPRDLHEALAAIAASDRRSLNATIALACEAALAARARAPMGGRWPSVPLRRSTAAERAADDTADRAIARNFAAGRLGRLVKT